MPERNIIKGGEFRSYPSTLRADDKGGIIGSAVIFDALSNDLGGFVEMIDRSAFDNTLMDDVVALFNHERDNVLGRTTSSTLRLELKEGGLDYHIERQTTQLGRDVEAMIKRGDINTSSFGFDVLMEGSSWTFDNDGRVLHRIHDIARLWDVSPVTWAAYSQTEVSLRAMDWVKRLQKIAENERGETQHKLDATREAAEAQVELIRSARLRQIDIATYDLLSI